MTVIGWIDVFTRERHRKTIVDALQYCIENKGLNVYAYVIMTNHLHMVVNCNEPFQLKDTIRDFKKFTTKKILNDIINEKESRRKWLVDLFTQAASISPKHKQFKLWKSGNHAIELYTEKFTWIRINYIHKNPVAAGLVRNVEDWRYSSASNYMELGDCVLPKVIRLKQLQKT